MFRAIAVMMGAASTSETSVNLYQTTRRNSPEDSHLLMLLLLFVKVSFSKLELIFLFAK
jgi:hypothetical protein